MGILLALTVLCAVFVRRISSVGGETLQDLADRQEQETTILENDTASADLSPAEEQNPSADNNTEGTSGFPDDTASDNKLPQQEVWNHSSDSGLPEQENTANSTAQDATQTKSETASPQENSAQSKGEPAMADRVTWQEGFYYESLSDTVKERITGISYPTDDSNAAVSYDMLRYVNVLYYDFQGETQTGELICHKAIAQDLVEIFYELYEARYPIERIALIDAYQGDDELSMQDNNTSCFNYRTRSSGKLSNHAYGLALDLNPLSNPYVASRSDGSADVAPAGSEDYVDRSRSFDYKIDKDDLACRLFTEHGFTWGGSWRSVKDYQHFEKEI